jgi:hypothetical protein
MPGVSQTPIPSKGLTIEYDALLTATPTDAGWTAVSCVQRVTGMGGVMREMAEHRCLDQGIDFVAKYPTGYRTAEDISFTFSYTGKKYTFLRSLVALKVPYLWRLRFPAEIIDGVAQTTRATEAVEAYAVSAKPNFPDDGKECTIELTLSPSKEGVFVEGTPAET